jgi:phage N-6-adenine-methyltransferase
MRNDAATRRDDWETPLWLFKGIEERWGPFTADAAATQQNSKCEVTFADGLTCSWHGHRVWCNPPYSNIGAWTQKAVAEGVHAVLLLPSYTGTEWWCRDVMQADEVVCIRKKFPFVGAEHNAPFYCVLAIWDDRNPTGDPRPPVLSSWEPERS